MSAVDFEKMGLPELEAFIDAANAKRDALVAEVREATKARDRKSAEAQAKSVIARMTPAQRAAIKAELEASERGR